MTRSRRLFLFLSLSLTACASPTPSPHPTATVVWPTPPADEPAPGTLLTWPDDSAPMVFVSSGHYLQGARSDDELASENEHPQHAVYITGFWIDQTEGRTRATPRASPPGPAARHWRTARTRARITLTIRPMPTTPSSSSVGSTRTTTAHGRASTCQRRPSGSEPREETMAGAGPGATRGMARGLTFAIQTALTVGAMSRSMMDTATLPR